MTIQEIVKQHYQEQGWKEDAFDHHIIYPPAPQLPSNIYYLYLKPQTIRIVLLIGDNITLHYADPTLFETIETQQNKTFQLKEGITK